MDRRRTFATFLIGLAALATTSTVKAPANETPPLREGQWIVASQRLVLLVNPAPACWRIPDNQKDAVLVRTGAAAFRTPLLLGGQAARAGLSCNSCHINGRSNPGFSFPGLSGVPGTADVTSSLLSSHRGDGIFNPKPIPDLSIDPPKISRDAADPALERFIHGLIVEEFDGPEPPPFVLKGMAAFVRNLANSDCRKTPATRYAVSSEIGNLQEALDMAKDASLHQDFDTATVMLASARSSLARWDERFPGPALAPQRARIAHLDDAVSQLLVQMRDHRDVGLQPFSDLSSKGWNIAIELDRLSDQSLYHPLRLMEALKSPNRLMIHATVPARRQKAAIGQHRRD